MKTYLGSLLGVLALIGCTANGTPLPVPPDSEFVSFDRLQCASNEATDSNYVSVAFATPHISDACGMFNGITLNPTTQNAVILPYAYDGSDGIVHFMWLGARFDTVDSGCTGERTITEDECRTQLLTCLNGCNTHTTIYKLGGAVIENCIIYSLEVNLS